MPISFNPNLIPSPDEIFFPDYPDFTPNITPTDMLKLGVFGGNYYSDPSTRENTGIDFDQLPLKKFGSPVPIAKNNRYKVLAGKSREWWDERNLINYNYDTEGWFHWYCRFFNGRRCPDDQRQITRWTQYKSRHYAGFMSRINKKPGNLNDKLQDDQVYPKYKQTLLQWAINPENELE